MLQMVVLHGGATRCHSQLLIKELGCGVMQSAIDPELLMLSKTNKRERRRHHAMRTLAILDEAVSRADIGEFPFIVEHP